jgi:putative glycosyltransferase (TIGR04348 family)
MSYNLKIQLALDANQRGNAVTAERWMARLIELGHRIVADDGDALVALHARRSHDAIVDFRARYPGRPVILALTGTDLYGDIRDNAQAQHSLKLADRFIVLQPHGLNELTPDQRARTHVIYQSCPSPDFPPAPDTGYWDACLVAHLRPVKDPLRAAAAVRLLPPGSKVRITHVGGVLDPALQKQAEAESASNPRYRWLGEQTREETLRTIAASKLLVLTSLMEGGANAVTEAIACRTPVVSSHMAGSIGLLGEDYPGFFPVGDTQALAALIQRAATDQAFYGQLKKRCNDLRPLVDPARERESWRALLDQLFSAPARL